MPCRIQIKENLTEAVETASDRGFNMSLVNAQKLAREINDSYKVPVVHFTQSEPDFINRTVTIPDNLVDAYYDYELELEEDEARYYQEEDASRAGVEYSDEYLFNQADDVPSSHAGPNTVAIVKVAASKMGINMQQLDDYAKEAGLDMTGVNGIADLVRGTIAVAQGMESQAITEEVVHIATAVLEQTDPKLVYLQMDIYWTTAGGIDPGHHGCGREAGHEH